MSKARKRRAVAPKASGGGGFAFEDKVGADLLALLLAGGSPLGSDLGLLITVEFQVGVRGWSLNDLLLTLEGGGVQRHAAVSVKSRRQVTSRSIQSESLDPLWQQFTEDSPSEYDRSQDYLVVAAPPAARTVQERLDSLLRKAAGADPNQLGADIEQPHHSSEIERSLYRCVREAMPPEVTAGEKHKVAAELLSRLRFLQYDFEDPVSQSEARAVARCRSLLEDESQVEAMSLWNALQVIARDHRSVGGAVTLGRILSLLRAQFQLKCHPDYSADWARLQAHAQEALAAIHKTIGGSLHLGREEELESVAARLQEKPILCIHGPSGSGKTVLAAGFAKATASSGTVLWLDSRSFSAMSFQERGHRMGVRHSMEDLLASSVDPSPLLVLDGLDRLFGEDLESAIQAIRPVGAYGPPGWRVLITCQTEEWPRVFSEMLRHGLREEDLGCQEVGRLSESQRRTVLASFPTLRVLFTRHDLDDLLAWPKVLDLLATNLLVSRGKETSQWVGESDLIRWFWDQVVHSGPDGYRKSVLLQKVARQEVESVAPGLPVTSLSDSEAGTLRVMEACRLCVVRHERVYLSHDLYGDWARQRTIVGQGEEASAFCLDRLHQPRWHKAIRLFALDLLERGDVDAWLAHVESDGENGTGGLLQDLCLDALFIAANPRAMLDRAWTRLVSKEGALLRRLLNRFLHVGTVPNPLLATGPSGQDKELSVLISTRQRFPVLAYWIPFLQALLPRQSALLEIAPIQIARIATSWLQLPANGIPYRRELAGVAMELGWRALKSERAWSHGKDRFREESYQAALMAARDLPEEVTTLALEACCRPPSNVAQAREESEQLKRLPPWPDGPRDAVEPVFRQLCLDTGALYPLMVVRPATAKEIVLALLLSPPEPERGSFGARGLPWERIPVEDIHGWFPPMYFRGPFQPLLHASPPEGIDAIVRLVNFAAEHEAHHAKMADLPRIALRYGRRRRRLLASERLYFWYRDSGPVPRAVACALMALEKWLYDLLEQGEPVDQWVTQILQTTDSVAFCGLLSAVGRKHPALFDSCLAPLLEAWQFYEWEIAGPIRHSGHQMIGWDMEGGVFQHLAREWHSLPHRNRELSAVGVRLLFGSKAQQAHGRRIRRRWIRELRVITAAGESAPYLERLIAIFNRRNWKPQLHKGRRVLAYVEPEELRQRAEPVLHESNQAMRLITFPYTCRQVIEGQKILDPDQLPVFWEEIQRFSRSTSADPDARKSEDAVCGGLAVLYVKHADWLKSDKSRLAWSRCYLDRLLLRPPAPSPFDVESADIGDTWQGFLAEIVVSLWSECPKSRRLRYMVSRVVSGPYYKTAFYVVRRALAVRSALGEELDRLVTFIVHWAAVRAVILRSHARHRSILDQSGWAGRLCRAFVRGTLPPKACSWSAAESTARRRLGEAWKRMDRQGGWSERYFYPPGLKGPRLSLAHPCRGPFLYTGILQSAFEAVPDLSKARSASERKAWIDLHQEWLGLTLRHLCGPLDKHGEHTGSPCQWDCWVFARTAALVLALTPRERPGNFWRPILQLGPPYGNWVSDFLTSWFLMGLPRQELRPRFRELWRAMLDFGKHSAAWKKAEGWEGSRCAELRRELLGMGWPMRELGKVEYAPLVVAMQDRYEAWIDGPLNDEDVRYLARLLQQESTTCLLRPGLVTLARHYRELSKDDWRFRGCMEDGVELVRVCFAKRMRVLRPDPTAYQAFHDLLTQFAAQQEPSALEILDRLSKDR